MRTIFSLLTILTLFTFYSCTKPSAERIENINGIDYSGNYTSQGYYYHPNGGRNINLAKGIYTHSLTSFLCEIGDLPSFIADDSAWSIVLEVDPITNNVTINPFPNVSNGPTDITMYTSLLPSPYTMQWPRSNECTNVYDPLTKEFKLRYGYYQGPALRIVEEIIKKN